MTVTSFSNLPAWLLLVIIVCAPMALACAGLLLVRHWMKRPEDEEHNILVSGMFATVSLIYTVLLAFLIISVWETFHCYQFMDCIPPASAIDYQLRDLMTPSQAHCRYRQIP